MLVNLELVKGAAINLDVNFPLTPHFRLYELANLKGDPTIPQYVINPQSLDFNCKLEAFRVMYGKPIVIQPNGSGYRQAEYNKQIGGIKGSAHTLARAIDWNIRHSDLQRKKIAELWKKAAGKGHVIFYPWGYHLDDVGDTFTVLDRR